MGSSEGGEAGAAAGLDGVLDCGRGGRMAGVDFRALSLPLSQSII